MCKTKDREYSEEPKHTKRKKGKNLVRIPDALRVLKEVYLRNTLWYCLCVCIYIFDPRVCCYYDYAGMFVV